MSSSELDTPSPSIITDIEKSKSNTFDCLIKILPNGLKALLVSDPTSENSACALGVHIGTLTDPPTEMGLAHFCEHLLFMGTEKYPSENEYYDYLSKNGGSSNAFTKSDKTVFYYKINNEAFEGSLDRFSQFFICPLFNENSVEREINAVDSEFSKNKNDDTRRLNQLFKSQFNPESPFSQFPTGNKEILNKKDIREKLLKMYNKYYTSEIMTLCLYSNMTLTSQINLVEKLFNDIPQRKNFVFPKYDKVKPFDEKMLSNFYKVIPVKNEDKLIFRFYFPFCPNYNTNPLHFYGSVIGHEGPNTITACLKKENLISDLTTSSEDFAGVFSVFKISINLTKKGFDNYKDVILKVLNYIYTLKNKNISERYFNELKNMEKIEFDFKNKIKPFNFVKKYAEKLMMYKPGDVFYAKEVLKIYDEELLKKYLNMFTLENLDIAFLSQTFEKECNEVEKFYGTKYKKEKLNIKKEEIINYKCDNYIFDYPPENKFIPQNLEILSKNTGEKIKKYPELIISEENCLVHFLQDEEFNLPKGMIKFRINFVKNLCNNSEVKNEIISHLLKKMIKLELNEMLYMAEVAGVEFKLKIFHDKLEITISAFNDSLQKGLKEFLIQIKNIDFNKDINKYKEILDIQKKEYLKKLKNFFLKKCYNVGIEYMKKVLNTNNLDNNELIDYLSNENNEITLEDIINFKKNMFLETKSIWLIQGNLEKKTAIDIVNSTNEIFNINVSKKIFKSFYYKRTVNLKPNINYIYRLRNPNKSEQDSCLLSIIQFDLLEKEQKQYFKLLGSFLSQKFFDTLRTQETLGYVVQLSKSFLLEIPHLIGIIQSSIKVPEYCSQRVKNFYEEKKDEIMNITDDEFNKRIKSLLVEEMRKDIKLKEQFERNWTEISLMRYKFNLKEENAEYLKKCTKEGFIQFYKKYMENDIKMLKVEYICDNHWDENEKIIKESKDKSNNNEKSEKIFKIVDLDNIYDLKNCNMLYPCANNPFYRKINS